MSFLTHWLALTALALPPAPPLKFQVDAPPSRADSMCYGSGLKVVAVERPGTGLATATLVINAGRNAEGAKQASAAHLLEHLWFQSRPDGGETIENRLAGLRIDAGTYTDVTTFTIAGVADDVAAIANLQAQSLIDPLVGVTAQAFATEQQVVLREHWYRGEHSYRAVQRTLDYATYPEAHPYHTSISTADDVQALTLEELQRFAKVAYVAAGATLVVEADLPLDDLFKVLESSLPREVLAGSGVPCRTVSPRNVPAKPYKTEMLHVKGAALTNELHVAWTAPPAWDITDAMWDEITRRLRLAILGRLSSVTGLKGHSAEYGVSCSHNATALATSVRCTLAVDAGAPPQELRKAVLAGAADVVVPSAERDFELGQDAYPRFRRAIQELASPSLSQAVRRARYTHFSGDAYPFSTRIESLSKMTDVKLAALAHDWLQPDRMVSVWLSRADTPKSAGVGLKPTVVLHRPKPEGWAIPSSVGDRLSAHTLSNGMPVWLVETPFAPLVDVGLIFDSGWLRAPEPGTNEVLEYILQYQPPMPPATIAADTSQSVSWGFEDWHNGFYASNVSTNLKVALYSPRITTETLVLDFTRRQNELDQFLKTAFNDFTQWPFSISASLRRGHLYAGTPLAMPWWQRNKAARYVRENIVRGWATQTVRPERAHVIVASDLPHSHTLPVVEKSYGRWKGRGKLNAPFDQHSLNTLPEKSQLFTIDAALPLTDVRLSCRLPGRTQATAPALDVLEAAADLALFQSLRSQGASYGPDATVLSWSPQVSELTLQADIAPSDANAALTLMQNLIKALRVDVPEGLLATAKLRAQHQHVLQFASSQYAVYTLDQEASMGLSATQIQSWNTEIAKVSAQDIAALLEPCVGHHAATIVGPNAKQTAEQGGLNPKNIDLNRTGSEIVDDLQ